MTAKGAAIHRTTRCHVARRRYFAEPPLDGLTPGSPGGSPYPSRAEEMSHEPHPSAKTGGRQSRRNEADTQNPVQLMLPHFEHEHGDEHDLVDRKFRQCVSIFDLTNRLLNGREAAV